MELVSCQPLDDFPIKLLLYNPGVSRTNSGFNIIFGRVVCRVHSRWTTLRYIPNERRFITYDEK